jgi:hypothetical protein
MDTSWFAVAVLFTNEEAGVSHPTGTQLRFAGPDNAVLYVARAPIAKLKAATAEGGIIGLAVSDGVPQFASPLKAQGLTETQASNWCHGSHWSFGGE